MHSAPVLARPKTPSVYVLALALACVPALIVGFGRFAYGLVLPAMRAELSLSFSQLGTLNTANTLGYLLGALLCAPLTRHLSERQMVIGGVLGSIVALVGTGFSRSFEALLFFRGLVGLTAAFGNIAATGMATRLGETPSQRALALGIAIAGPSLGVVFTGLTLPFLLGDAPERWPLAWEFMALTGAILAVFIFALLKSVPPAPPQHERENAPRPDFRPLLPALGAYFLFGLGYIAYMTFLVAYVRGLGASPATVALTWAILGCAMFASSFVWRKRLENERGGTSLFLMGIFAGISAILPLFSGSLGVLLLSAMGFGVTTMAVYTAVTVLLRLHWPPALWTLGVAYATTIFALGQSIGPFAAGHLSDHFGPKASLVWSAAILTLAGIVAFWQKSHPHEAR